MCETVTSLVIWPNRLYCPHLALEGDSNAVLLLYCTAASRGFPSAVGCPGHLVQGWLQPGRAASGW